MGANLWNLIKALKFVSCDAMDIDDLSQILAVCDDNNFHWILVYCLYDLNRMLFVKSTKNEIFEKNVTLVCEQFGLFADHLKTMFVNEVNKNTKYELNGIHLEKLWRFVSVLCFTAYLLFRHWINESDLNDDDVHKVIVEKYRFISKKVDGIKRTLSDILEGIQSQFKVVNIGKDDLSQKQMDKLLKNVDIDKLRLYESNIKLDESMKDVNRLRTIKIAMININNNITKNNIDILKQNLLILKQLKFTV